MERRFAKVEIRAANDGRKTIEGYAAVFNSLSGDLGGFREQIAPGAFTRALAEKPDVLCLLNHDASQMLGRTASGTCEIEQDDTGLRFRCDMPDTTLGRDLYEQIKRGDISQCSFSFTCDDDEWDEMDDEQGRSFVRRTVVGVRKLFDVSPVAMPAYPATSVSAN
jgi:uncharacterized protein